MPLANFQALLKELAAQIGSPDLDADDRGYVALSYEDVVLHLQFDPEEDEVVVFTRLPEVDEDRAEEIYALLLGANLFWQGTARGTLALEPVTGAVFLMDRRPLALLRIESLVAWLERFQGAASHWGGRIADANGGGSASPLPDGAEAEPAAVPPPEPVNGRGAPAFIIRG